MEAKTLKKPRGGGRDYEIFPIKPRRERNPDAKYHKYESQRRVLPGIYLRLPLNCNLVTAENINALAKKHGMTRNAFCVRLIRQALEEDRGLLERIV